jgi:hypothetical protein
MGKKREKPEQLVLIDGERDCCEEEGGEREKKGDGWEKSHEGHDSTHQGSCVCVC